jgi:hypothetical protein
MHGFGEFYVFIDNDYYLFTGDFVDGIPKGKFYMPRNGDYWCENVNSFDDLYDCNHKRIDDMIGAAIISNAIACSKCVIDDSKTEIPENTQDVWGILINIPVK